MSSGANLRGSKAASHGASELRAKVKRLVFGVLELNAEGVLSGRVVDRQDASNGLADFLAVRMRS